MSTIQQNTQRMVSVAHGGANFEFPIGASFTGTTDWKTNYPATVITDQTLAIQSQQLTAQVKFQGLDVPIDPLTLADLSIVVLQFSGTNATLGIPTMLAGSYGFDANSPVHSMTNDFRYQGTDIMPVTVALT